MLHGLLPLFVDGLQDRRPCKLRNRDAPLVCSGTDGFQLFSFQEHDEPHAVVEVRRTTDGGDSNFFHGVTKYICDAMKSIQRWRSSCRSESSGQGRPRVPGLARDLPQREPLVKELLDATGIDDGPWPSELLSCGTRTSDPCPDPLSDALALLAGHPRENGEQQVIHRTGRVEPRLLMGLHHDPGGLELLQVRDHCTDPFAAQPIERPDEHGVELATMGGIEERSEPRAISTAPAGLVDVLGNDFDAEASGPRSQGEELRLGGLPALGAKARAGVQDDMFHLASPFEWRGVADSRWLEDLVGRRSRSTGLGGYDMDSGDELAERAQLIAARAKRLLVDEFTQWEGYCLPGCANCAIEFAREQLDEEQGWDATEESRATSEAAMRRAVDLVEDAGIHERGRLGW